jgi:putative transposase
MAEMAALLVLRKKVGGLLLGGSEKLTSTAHRRKAIELSSEAHTAGTALVSGCSEIDLPGHP